MNLAACESRRSTKWYTFICETSQRDELNAVSRQAIGRVALRAHLVLLSDRGFTVPQIAAIHACGQDVVLTWLHRYERKGVSGLEDEPRSGRPLNRSAGWTHRGCPGQSVATLFGTCPERLACGLVGGLPGPALSLGPFLCLASALPAPNGLALGQAPAGPSAQARPGG